MTLTEVDMSTISNKHDKVVDILNRKMKEDSRNGLPTLKYTENSTGAITVTLPNGLTFLVDLYTPDVIERLKETLKEPNPLKQLLVSRHISYPRLSAGMKDAISHQTLHLLATGQTPLSEEIREKLRDNLGIDFDPKDFLTRGMEL